MFNAAFVEHLNGTLEDPQFGSYKRHDKGGCEQENDGACGFGCLREFIDWNHNLRLTFTFKTLANQATLVLDHLITQSISPDVFVLATGAHDFYQRHSVETTIQDTKEWIYSMKLQYPNANFIFLTLVSCHKQFKARAMEFNKAILTEFQTLSWIHVIDREPSTIDITNPRLCEG